MDCLVDDVTQRLHRIIFHFDGPTAVFLDGLLWQSIKQNELPTSLPSRRRMISSLNQINFSTLDFLHHNVIQFEDARSQALEVGINYFGAYDPGSIFGIALSQYNKRSIDLALATKKFSPLELEHK